MGILSRVTQLIACFFPHVFQLVSLAQNSFSILTRTLLFCSTFSYLDIWIDVCASVFEYWLFSRVPYLCAAVFMFLFLSCRITVLSFHSCACFPHLRTRVSKSAAWWTWKAGHEYWNLCSRFRNHWQSKSRIRFSKCRGGGIFGTC